MDPVVCSRYVLVTDHPLGLLRGVLKFGGVKVDRTKKLIAVAGAAAVVVEVGAAVGEALFDELLHAAAVSASNVTDASAATDLL